MAYWSAEVTSNSVSRAHLASLIQPLTFLRVASQPHLPIRGPSGLLTKPQLWKPRDRNASMLRYGPGHARGASPPTQIKQDPDADTHAGASASLLSFGTLATSESPSVLAVERARNSRLKRARDSTEYGDSDNEERRRPRVKVKLESLDNNLREGLHPRTRKRARAAGSTTSTRLESRNELPDPHTAYGQGSSSTPFSLNTLPPMSSPTPAQLLTPISLAVERKNLKRARNSAGDDDDGDGDEEEARKARRRIKFEDAASTSSDGGRSRMRAQPRARTPFPFRRPAQSRSVAARLRRDSFGSISADGPRATGAVSAPPAAVPPRRSARLQAKPKRVRMCAVCPEALDCHIHIL
jgi:hypothetical protein